MAFVLGKTEADLQAQRKNTLREIEARGGKAKAPSYVERLNQIDGALRSMRGNGGQQAPGGNDGNPFNAQGYLSANPDVAREAERLQASGDRRTKEQIALDHWNNNGKAEGRSFVPTSTPPVNPTNDPAPLGPIPEEIKTLPDAINAEKTVADAQAKGQIAYGNAATETNPFGEKTVGFDESGRPVVKESLSPEQQKILEQQQQLSQTGGQAAQNIIKDAGLDQAFNPTLDPRIAQGDLLGFRQKQQQDLEQYLTRDFQRDKARDLNTLETSLYNRGIPLDRQAEAYDRAIEGLNRDYDARYAGAAAQALQLGKEEAKQLYDMNEGTIAAQLNQAGQINQQNVSNAQNMSTLGTGLIVPQFTPFQGGTYQLGSPTDIQTQLQTAKLNAQQTAAQNKLINAQTAAANRSNTGAGRGSNGNTGSTAQSPFVDM